MEKPELKDSVCCNLRSVTQSIKGGVPLNRLERDYRDLIGSAIPYRDLGHNSLESFIRAIPTVIHLTKGRDGYLMAEAVADSSTAHIASLISRQKVTSKAKATKRFSTRRGGYAPKPAYRGERNSYGSYSASKSSGRSYKHDYKAPQGYHSRPQKTTPPPLNFRIEVKNTNHIPVDKTPAVTTTKPLPAPSTARQPSPPAADKSKSKPPFMVRGYEIAPRFQRLLQRKVEAREQEQRSQESSSSSNSHTPRSSVTPPRTPSPNPYAFTASSLASAHSSSSRTSPTDDIFYPPPSEPLAPTQVSYSPVKVGSNGFASARPRSPLQLRARLTAKTLSQQLESAQSSKEYVEIYARINNLALKFATSTIGQRKPNKGYVTVLHLGDHKHLSYPDIAQSEFEAEEIAAEKAVNKIKESLVLPETSISNAEEIQIFLNRIEELVYEKPSGMFNNGLQLEYESHFKEKLPSCWVQLIKESSTIEIDEVEVYGKVPEGANFIVRPSRIISSGSTTPSEPSEKVHTELQNSEVEESLPKAEVSGNNQPMVPPLEIPAGNEWGVYITGVYALDAMQLIAARLVDSDADFLTLLTNMSVYYNSTIDPVDVVEELRLYATIEGLIDGDLAVHRVLVTRVLDNDLVECYYVDEGTVDIVKKGDLQYLHIDFLGLPYQAMHFELDGLEDYEPFMTSEHLDSLKYKTFIAVVKRWLQEESYFPDDPSIQKVIYSVALYDTSSSEIDICLNDNVKKLVSESLICKLPKLNVSLQGYLTHVTSTGQIYVRFLHPTKSWLEAELESLSPRFEEACLENSSFVPGGSIFAAKNKFDNKWYRAAIPEKPNVPTDPELLEVIFVDHGYPCFVKKSEICDLHLISEFLFSLSYQAIKCDLYNALPSPSSKWTIAASQRLIEMAPMGEELIIRVISEEEGDTLPKISLHKRIYNKDDSFIISINENLACKPELFLDSSTDPVILKPPTKLNLQPKSVQPLSKGLASSIVPSVSSPVERDLATPLKNLDITSPVGIQWATTPDMLKSPEDEDLSPPPLTQPQVPEAGQMFDVFVTTAANPHNFIVQPLQSSKEMNDLMIQMQQFYSVEDNLIEMHPSLLQRNSFYAALHPDGAWYRVRLVSFNPGEPEEALVFYVDFGDYDKVYLQNLQKLYNQFRGLPCQAIKASLQGIMPLDADWKPEHCVNFKSMVTEQKFVSIIKKKRLAQDQGFSSLELELTLIDTTDPEADVFIHELLITNFMARRTTF